MHYESYLQVTPMPTKLPTQFRTSISYLQSLVFFILVNHKTSPWSSARKNLKSTTSFMFWIHGYKKLSFIPSFCRFYYLVFCCILPVCFGTPIGALSSNSIQSWFYLSKKKKKKKTVKKCPETVDILSRIQLIYECVIFIVYFFNFCKYLNLVKFQ